MTPTRPTIADLLAFIDDLPATHGVAGRTADAYRTAIRVLQHALGLAPDTDVVDLDVEEALSRLRARTAGRYTHHSIETYCGNIHRIIGLFTGRLPGWKVRPRQGRRGVVTPAPTITYTVQSGDTLSAIAKKFLGNPNDYMELFNANRDQLTDPDRIRPGQVLKIPQHTKA